MTQHVHAVQDAKTFSYEEQTSTRPKKIVYEQTCSCGATRKLAVVQGTRTPDPWDEPTRRIPIFNLR